MAKDPSFPLYASDFFMDTLTWSEDHVGAWIRILSYLWINGPSTKDALLKVSSNAQAVLEHCDGKMQAYGNGTISNIKLEEVRAEREANRNKRSAKGKAAAKARWDKERKVDDSTVCPEHTTGNAKRVPFKEREEEEEKEKEEKKEREDNSENSDFQNYDPSPTFESLAEAWLDDEEGYPLPSGERSDVMAIGRKIRKRSDMQISENEIFELFKSIISNLDQWTRSHKFNMGWINENFATIVKGINERKKTPPKKGNKPSALDKRLEASTHG